MADQIHICSPISIWPFAKKRDGRHSSIFHRLGVYSGSSRGNEKAKQYLNLLWAEGCPFFTLQWNILAISMLFKLSMSLIHLETQGKKKNFLMFCFLSDKTLKVFLSHWEKKKLAWKNNFQLSFSDLWKLWERGSTELSKIQSIWWSNKPPHGIPAIRMLYTQIALCCSWIVLTYTLWNLCARCFQGLALGLQRCLANRNTKQQVWGSNMNVDWVPNTLCDAVLICTVHYASSTTACVTGCYSDNVS